MDKLIVLCDMFGVTMDDLVRGNVMDANEQISTARKEEYILHNKVFAAKITSGVACILIGVASMLLLYGVTGSNVSVISLFVFLSIGAGLCISAGLSHESFERMYSDFSFDFSGGDISANDRRFRRNIIIGVSAIFIDVALLVASFVIFPETGKRESMLIVSGFMAVLAIAVALLTWSGIIKNMYDLGKYDKSKNGGVDAAANEKSDRICGAVMMSATAVYMILGFVFQLWHPGWVVFPVGGIICGIVSTLMND